MLNRRVQLHFVAPDERGYPPEIVFVLKPLPGERATRHLLVEDRINPDPDAINDSAGLGVSRHGITQGIDA